MYDESPNTLKLFKPALEGEFYRWHVVQAAISLFTACTYLTPHPYLCGVFGTSGIGKTLAQMMGVALVRNGKYKVYAIEKGGITMAGLSRIAEKAEEAESRGTTSNAIDEYKEMLASENIFLEDLSDVTDYVASKTVSMFTSMTESLKFDYFTGNETVSIELPCLKRICIGGTDADYFQLMKDKSWDNKVKRRVIPLMYYLFPRELDQRVTEVDEQEFFYQKSSKEMARELFVRYGWDKIKVGKVDYGNVELKSVASRESRNEARRLLARTKTGFADPNSTQYLTTSLAYGHAIFNNRDYLCSDDFQFIADFIERFALPFNAWDFRVFMYLMTKATANQDATNMLLLSPDVSSALESATTQRDGLRASLSELVVALDTCKKTLTSKLAYSRVVHLKLGQEERENLDSAEFEFFGQPKYLVEVSPSIAEIKKRWDSTVQQLKNCV